jgi:hypothetical protein
VRLNMTSPFASGCAAAVIFAVIWLLTGGGGGRGLVLGSLLCGAVATAITFLVHAVVVTRRSRA